MRYDAQNRIMSLTFTREPAEHAEIMLAASRRMMAPRGFSYGWTVLAGAVAFGAAVGISMELYRRFVLSPLLGIADVTPLNVIVLQFLPVLLLGAVTLAGCMRYVARRRKQALTDRLEPDLFVDVDVFRDGVRVTAGTLTVSLEWTGIRTIQTGQRRIELEGENFTAYIPLRAFDDRPAFDSSVAEIRTLWQDARRKQMLGFPDARSQASKILSTGL